jgi:hypothetical protein
MKVINSCELMGQICRANPAFRHGKCDALSLTCVYSLLITL